ncbi:unnamed protein product [Chrysoparadoxa australica]
MEEGPASGSTVFQEVEADLSSFGVFASLDVDPSGALAVLGGRRGLTVLELDCPTQPITTLQSRSDITHVRWNPQHSDKHYVASVSKENTLVFNVEATSSSTAVPIATLRKHTMPVTDISWSPLHPSILASSSVDSYVYVWDLRSPSKPVQAYQVPQHKAAAVQWNRVNMVLLASAHDKELRVWDSRKVSSSMAASPQDKGSAATTAVTAHIQPITGLDWSHTRAHDVVTCSSDKYAKRWDVQFQPSSGSWQHTNLDTGMTHVNQKQGALSTLEVSHRGFQVPLMKIRFTPFGNGVITTSRGIGEKVDAPQTIQMFSLSNEYGEFKWVTQFSGHTRAITATAWRVVEDREKLFQLASIDNKQHLRLHRIRPSHLRECGYELPQDHSLTEESEAQSYSGKATGRSKLTLTALKGDLLPAVTPSSSSASGRFWREVVEVETLASSGALPGVAVKRIDLQSHSAEAVVSTTVTMDEHQAARVMAGSIPPDTPTGPGEPPSSKLLAVEASLMVLVAFSARLPPTEPTFQLAGTFTAKPLEHVEPKPEATDAGGAGTGAAPQTCAMSSSLLKALSKQAASIARPLQLQQMPFLEQVLRALYMILNRRLSQVSRLSDEAGTQVSNTPRPSDANLQFSMDEGGPPGATPTAAARTEAVQERLEEVIDIGGKRGHEVPCPVLFGASFAQNGVLVVFSSALPSLGPRMGMRNALKLSPRGQLGSPTSESDDDTPLKRPRTYSDLLECARPTYQTTSTQWTFKSSRMDHSPESQENYSKLHGQTKLQGISLGFAADDATDDEEDDTQQAYVDGLVSDGPQAPRPTALQPVGFQFLSGNSSQNQFLSCGPQQVQLHRANTPPPPFGEYDEGMDELHGEWGTETERWAPRANQANQVVLVDVSDLLPASDTLAELYSLGQWQQKGGQKSSCQKTSSDRTGASPSLVPLPHSSKLPSPLHLQRHPSEGIEGSPGQKRMMRGMKRAGSSFLLQQLPAASPGAILGARKSVGAANKAGKQLSHAKQWESSPDLKHLNYKYNRSSSKTAASPGEHAMSIARTGSVSRGLADPGPFAASQPHLHLLSRIPTSGTLPFSGVLNTSLGGMDGATQLPVGINEDTSDDGGWYQLGFGESGEDLGAGLTTNGMGAFSGAAFTPSGETGASSSAADAMHHGAAALSSTDLSGEAAAAGYNIGVGMGIDSSGGGIDSSTHTEAGGTGSVGLAMDTSTHTDAGAVTGSSPGAVVLAGGGLGIVPMSGADAGAEAWAGAAGWSFTNRHESQQHADSAGVIRQQASVMCSENLEEPDVLGARELWRSALGDCCRVNAEAAAKYNKILCVKYEKPPAFKAAHASDLVEVWALLAETADAQAWDAGASQQMLRPWSQGAFGQPMLEKICKHYQACDDVQMLATMLCVLGSNEGGPDTSLLPPHISADSFNRCLEGYGQLLYAWGAHEQRVEALKHKKPSARRRTLSRHGGQKKAVPRTGQTSQRRTRAAMELDPELTLSSYAKCSKCHQVLVEGKACQKCQEFSVRCSLCHLTARGMASFCFKCGHGGASSAVASYTGLTRSSITGHVNHLEQWFSQHSSCPTGLYISFFGGDRILLAPLHSNLIPTATQRLLFLSHFIHSPGLT